MRKISINGVILDINNFPIQRSGRFHKVKKGNDGGIVTPPPTLPQGSGDVIVKVKFATNPTTATTEIPKLKYGKKSMVHMEIDDSAIDFVNAWIPYMQGGTAFDGVTYPGKVSTDGCGNPIKWTAAIALNVRNSLNDSLNLEIGDPGVIGLSHLPYILNSGCVPVPHGYYHGDDPNEVPPSGYVNEYLEHGFTRSLNLSENVKYIWEKTGGFLPRYMIIPSASTGYNVPAKAQGLLAQSSQGVFDGEPRFPNDGEEWVHWNSFVDDVIALNGAYIALGRQFFNNWYDQSILDYHQGILDYAVQNGTYDNPQFTRYGTHSFLGHMDEWTNVKWWLDHISEVGGDDVWVTNAHEFLEYLEVRRLIQKTETLVGDTLTIRLNYNNIPVQNLYRDISLMVNADAAIESVTVNNAQNSSYNTTTGLINIFNKRHASVIAYPYSELPAPGGGLPFGIIPIEEKDIWMDNAFNPDVKPAKLIDGDLINNYGFNYQFIYPTELNISLERHRATVSNVRIYWGFHDGTSDTDVILTRKDGTEVVLGTWTQEGENTYQDFVYSGTEQIQKVTLKANGATRFGAEIEITGTYQPLLSNPYKKPRTPLGYQIGWNVHPWHFSKNVPQELYTEKISAFKSLDMLNGSIRMYDAWWLVQELNGNWRPFMTANGFKIDEVYQLLQNDMPNLLKWRVIEDQSLILKEQWDVSDPTKYLTGTVTQYNDNGSWGQLFVDITGYTGSGYTDKWHMYKDGVYIDTADNGHSIATSTVGQNIYFFTGGALGLTAGQVIQFRKSQASQVGANWPSDNNLIKSDTASYDELGKVAFVYASRYGTNPNVPDYPVASDDTMLKGSGLCQIFEFVNEADHWWDSNPYKFWNGADQATMWSMCYDGHMGQFPNRGIKQADPNAIMATTGLAWDRLDRWYGAIERTKQIRGYNPDGTLNFPADILNFHCYSLAGGQYSGSQGGLPPEQGMIKQVKDAVWLIETMLPTLQLYISEWGWDANQGSAICAKTFGSYTNARQVAAMWHIRGMLLFAKEGLDRAQAYRLYQDANYEDSNAGIFATMAGLRPLTDNVGETVYNRTAVGDYFKQIAEFREYKFDSVIDTGITGVYCYRFKDPDTSEVFIALWSEEQTTIVGSIPSFTERAGTFAVPVPNNANLNIRQFVDDGSGVMSLINVTAVGTSHNVSYGSKPKIIQILAT